MIRKGSWQLQLKMLGYWKRCGRPQRSQRRSPVRAHKFTDRPLQHRCDGNRTQWWHQVLASSTRHNTSESLKHDEWTMVSTGGICCQWSSAMFGSAQRAHRCVSLAMYFLSDVQNITCVTADRTCCYSQSYRKDKEFVGNVDFYALQQF